jgi:hypothetical protein
LRQKSDAESTGIGVPGTYRALAGGGDNSLPHKELRDYAGFPVAVWYLSTYGPPACISADHQYTLNYKKNNASGRDYIMKNLIEDAG